MKNLIIGIIFIIGLVLGLFLGSNDFFRNDDSFLAENNNIENTTPVKSGEGSQDTTVNSALSNQVFKNKVLTKYLSKISKKYEKTEKGLLLYLEDAVGFIKEKGFENNNFYGGRSENIDETLKNDLENLDTSNFNDVSTIIYSIHMGNKGNKVSKQVCKEFLDSLDDIGSYLSDTSLLLYSNYIKSPLLQVEVDEKDYIKFYNSEKKITAFLEKGKSVDYLIKKSIIGDILWLNQAPTLDLKGFSEAVYCDEAKERKKYTICNTFKSDLFNGNKEGILNKFKTNERKYDVDSFYTRYLIKDLSKSELTSKLCLID